MKDSPSQKTAIQRPEQSEWAFYNPVQIFFGGSIYQQIDALLVSDKSLVVICTSQGRRRIENNSDFYNLINGKDHFWVDDVDSNPDVDWVQERIDSLRGVSPGAIVAIGGGSVMDTAKAFAIALGSSSGEDLRQLIASPEILNKIVPVALMAIPTTSGTGSEVTSFATLWDRSAKKKLSLAGPNMYPRWACLDPGLTLDLPEEVTVATGLDAINQAFESIWNKNASSITIQYAMRAIQLGFESLLTLISRPDDLAARRDMMECSMLAGLAISQTRTALCHSMSYPLTSHFDIPHGLACAFTMHSVFELNVSYEPSRLQNVAEYLNMKDTDVLHARLGELLSKLRVGERVRAQLPSLVALTEVAGEMFTSGRVDNCLFPVTDGLLVNILEMSYQQP